MPADQVEAAYARIHELELLDNDGVRLLPGTVDAFASLPATRQAIVTSCTRPLAAARIAAAGLVPPAVVVTADDVTHGKPDPDPFLLGAERLGVDPSRCLVVEDAPVGVASGRAAGARCSWSRARTPSSSSPVPPWLPTPGRAGSTGCASPSGRTGRSA
ncbi:HAD-IA family hydrolase [Oerskovia sp. M15]